MHLIILFRGFMVYLSKTRAGGWLILPMPSTTFRGLDTLFFQLENDVVHSWLSQAERS